MAKSLVIVESPAKAKTITGFLGGGYIVMASKGHIRDLDKFRYGVNITDTDVIPNYIITPDHKEIVKFLIKSSVNAEQVYLATDEDREGEAISYHIAEVIGKDYKTLPRIAFHEITKTAILHALANPRKLDIDMVNSQQARRILDRIVGFKVSGLLNKKYVGKMSAGRVQSSTLSIVVDREIEIMNFKPIKFEVIHGVFDSEEVKGELKVLKGERLPKLRFQDKEETRQVLEYLNGLTYKVSAIESRRTKSKPNGPFTTSTLQQEASNRLGFSPDRTMRAAQKLYEGVETHVGTSGVITYMRTDSLNIAEEALTACRDYILKNFGQQYLSTEPKRYTTSSKGAQEAHEAIRPTNLDFTPERAKKFLEKDQYELYALIYNRFLACQSVEAEFEAMKMTISSLDGENEFHIHGSKLVFDGYQKFVGNSSKEKLLPNISNGHVFKKHDIKSEEKETQPPGRYSEASLVQVMEKLGIGRPSTYASTIALLVSREYVTKEGKSLKATEKAIEVIKVLREHFPKIVDLEFTAKMEAELDLIGEGKLDWKQFLIGFNKELTEWLNIADTNIVSNKAPVVKTGRTCPKCNKNELVERNGRFGKFISCSGYPRCKYAEFPNKEKVDPNNLPKTGQSCPKCSSDIVEKEGRYGKYFTCLNRLDGKCDFISKYLPVVGKSCPTCNGYMIPRGKDIVCPKCQPSVYTKGKKTKSKK